jgi:spermidine synthase
MASRRSAPRRRSPAPAPAPAPPPPPRDTRAWPVGNQRERRTLLAAFLLSGFAGLMHEVVWAKLLVELIGTTAYAQAAVLTVFMGGIALGSIYGGRYVDRTGRPLQAYVRLELSIAGYCLVLPFVLTAVGAGYDVLAARWFESPLLTLALRFCLALAIVLPPAVLMGATLPVLARHLITRLDETQRQVASLYALNNLGAVLGAGVAGFVTLPLVGVYPSLILASLANAAAGGLVMGPARAEGRSPVAVVGGAAPAPGRRAGRGATVEGPRYGTAQYTVALVALAMSGFAAMGYEVLFLRVIGLAFGSSTYSFTVMLMVFIAGIGIGSALLARRPAARPLALLGTSQLLVVAAFVAATPLVARLPYLLLLLRVPLHTAPGGFAVYLAGKAALCFAILLVPTVCLGFGFPLVAQIQARSPERTGALVGSTYAWNTVGNVLGVVVTTLVLLPRLGLLHAFHLVLALNLAAGLAILWVAREMPVVRRAAVAAAAGVVVAVYLVLGTSWTSPILLARDHLRLRTGPDPDAPPAERAAHATTSFAAWKKEYVVDPEALSAVHVSEDAHTSVLAIREGDDAFLFVNTKPDASTAGDLTTQALLAHAPLFLAPHARTIFVIGYGSGITAGSALRHPVERADIVEISPGVIEADVLFADHNYGVLHDPRTHVYLDDAQSFLRGVPRTYDVIISEPSNPWVAGVGGLFTVDFFERVRSHLNPGGVAAIWFHEYEQSSETVTLVLRTLRTVFPHVYLFREYDLGDVIAVASPEPIEIDFAAMERRFEDPAVREDLMRLGITNLVSLLSHQGTPPSLIDALIGSGPINTMRHERLAYVGPRSFFRGEYSADLRSLDSLAGGEVADDETLLGQYRAWRAEVGDPVSKEELDEAARYHAVQSEGGAMPAATALRSRAEHAPARAAPATRGARGAVPEISQMGFHEAVYWGRRRRDEDDPQGAIPYYRRALEVRPDDVPRTLELAEMLQAAGLAPEAVTLLKEHYARRSDEVALLHGLAWAYLHAGDVASARETHLAVVAREERADSLSVLGAMLIGEGKRSEAIPYFERALAADPKYWRASVDLASALEQNPSSRPRARRVLEDALAYDPTNEPVRAAYRDLLASGG